MTLRDWVKETVVRCQKYGPKEATRRSGRELLVGGIRRIGRSIPAYGDYIFEQEWDVLIVLDACRWDALDEVKDEYEWLPNEIPKVTSRGTYSRDWMQENFSDKFESEKAVTDHVTWNAFSDYELDEPNWHSLNEVWRDVWNDELGLLPPRPVTDRAIKIRRESDANKLLVHYMQPHAPYRNVDETEPLEHAMVGEINAERVTIWELLREGEIGKEEAWEAYIDNLRWALDDIELLIENMDAEKPILTADHGDCFGEWLLYGHPHGIPVPELKRVPWVELSAEDNHTYEPDIDAKTGSEMEDSVEDRLEQLGYL